MFITHDVDSYHPKDLDGMSVRLSVVESEGYYIVSAVDHRTGKQYILFSEEITDSNPICSGSCEGCGCK